MTVHWSEATSSLLEEYSTFTSHYFLRDGKKKENSKGKTLCPPDFYGAHLLDMTRGSHLKAHS